MTKKERSESLENVLNRRLKYFDDKDIKPDLIVIDGGKTQLKFTRSIIKASIHNDIKVISIAKGGNRVRATETIFSANGIVEFDKYSKSYLLLQEMRDEAHRFAITGHRNKKRKKLLTSDIQSIEGIGPNKKKDLLKQFGGIQEIKRASVEDLMTVRGINNLSLIHI